MKVNNGIKTMKCIATATAAIGSPFSDFKFWKQIKPF